MSLTINGTTNTLTAASGLNVAGNTAVTGTLSATGLLSGTAGVQFRGADATSYELLRVVGAGANNPGLFVKATEATKTVELFQSGSPGGEILVVGGIATYTSTALTLGSGVNLVMAAASTVQLGGYTVATLPAAGTAGRTAYVTDATAPTYLGALTGGGAVVCPVFDNGVAWVSA